MWQSNLDQNKGKTNEIVKFEQIYFINLKTTFYNLDKYKGHSGQRVAKQSKHSKQREKNQNY